MSNNRPGRRARKNVAQYNCKQTNTEKAKLEQINKEYGNGQWNKSQVIRFLVKIALLALDKGTIQVEKAHGVKIEGVEANLD